MGRLHSPVKIEMGVYQHWPLARTGKFRWSTGLGKLGHVLWIYDLHGLWDVMVLKICLGIEFIPLLPDFFQLAGVRGLLCISFRCEHVWNVMKMLFICFIWLPFMDSPIPLLVNTRSGCGKILSPKTTTATKQTDKKHSLVEIWLF